MGYGVGHGVPPRDIPAQYLPAFRYPDDRGAGGILGQQNGAVCHRKDCRMGLIFVGRAGKYMELSNFATKVSGSSTNGKGNRAMRFTFDLYLARKNRSSRSSANWRAQCWRRSTATFRYARAHYNGDLPVGLHGALLRELNPAERVISVVWLRTSGQSAARQYGKRHGRQLNNVWHLLMAAKTG